MSFHKRYISNKQIIEMYRKEGMQKVYDWYTKGVDALITETGLASDVCIHGHLSAGTAALECALEGIPTLLIDREGAPYSKLSELPKEKVVFQDWPSAIDSMLLHFNSPEGLPGFGDWSSIIDELDPFRDGMAANRMGTYLKWLIDGFDDNLDKEVVMLNAAKMYIKKWGSDKIIIS